jgi:hypothetical protein
VSSFRSKRTDEEEIERVRKAVTQLDNWRGLLRGAVWAGSIAAALIAGPALLDFWLLDDDLHRRLGFIVGVFVGLVMARMFSKLHLMTVLMRPSPSDRLLLRYHDELTRLRAEGAAESASAAPPSDGASCPVCRDLRERLEIRLPGELTRAIRLARERMRDGSLLLDGDAGAFAGLRESGPWPDVVDFSFRGAACGALFRLWADAYHGRGGVWRPADSDEERLSRPAWERAQP